MGHVNILRQSNYWSVVHDWKLKHSCQSASRICTVKDLRSSKILKKSKIEVGERVFFNKRWLQKVRNPEHNYPSWKLFWHTKNLVTHSCKHSTTFSFQKLSYFCEESSWILKFLAFYLVSCNALFLLLNFFRGGRCHLAFTKTLFYEDIFVAEHVSNLVRRLQCLIWFFGLSVAYFLARASQKLQIQR